MRVYVRGASAALVALLAGVLTACSSGGGSTAEQPPASNNTGTASQQSSGSQAAPAKNYQIAVLLATQIPFHQSMACGARAAAKDLGVSLNIQAPPTTDVAAQISELHTVLATKPDAIVITAANTTAPVESLKQAKNLGVKVIFADSAVDNWQDVGVSFIATDNVAAGRQAADSLISSLNGKGGTVAVINYAPGIQTLIDRTTGFVDEIKTDAKLKLLPVQYANSTAKAQSQFLSLYAAHPDLVGVLGTSESVTIGLGAGVVQADAQGKVAAYGFDASEAEVSLVEKGALAATVMQRPYEEGELAVKTAVAALEGKPFDQNQSVTTSIVTKDNYQDPDIQKYIYKGSCI